MKKTSYIGITGGIGSGKTTVCNIFKSLGIPVYDADAQAKILMYRNPALKKSIKSLLGDEAYHRNGRLNRAYVAQKIFSDKKLLAGINGLVHPAVYADSSLWFSEQTAPYALKEAALLVENGSYKKLDGLIVVSAPEETRIARVVKRDRTSEVSVRQRIKNQLPEKAKTKVADFIIYNDGSQSLLQQVQAIHKKLIAK